MTYRFLIAPLATLAVVVACSPVVDTTNEEKRYEDCTIIQSHQIAWPDVLNQKENNYIVFFYSETCGYCHEMLNEIVDFANSDILETYFVNCSTNKVTISEDYGIGISNIEELSIKGTPSIIEVFDKVVVANVPGLENCLTYLNEKRIENNYIL